MPPLLSITRKRPSRNGSAKEGLHEFDTSCSGKTIDADASCRSAAFDLALDEPGSPRRPRGCLRVHTQRESLTRIATKANETSESGKPHDLHTLPEHHQVRFDTVELREYHRALGDNPSTSSGPPIGIDWAYDPKRTIVLDVDTYEDERGGSRRAKRDLAIPPHVRVDMLREAGYSRKDITQATRCARRDKDRRIVSYHRQKFDPIVERVETVRHGVKRMCPRTYFTS